MVCWFWGPSPFKWTNTIKLGPSVRSKAVHLVAAFSNIITKESPEALTSIKRFHSRDPESDVMNIILQLILGLEDIYD